MRIDSKERGTRFNRAKSLSKRLGEIFRGNSNLQLKDVNEELSKVQYEIDKLNLYKSELFIIHSRIMNKDKPVKRKNLFLEDS